MFQSGLPDYWCVHRKYGTRWIETKTDLGSLTESQWRVFAQIVKHGGGIWVLRDERDYLLLFKDPNITTYMSDKKYAFIRVK